MTHKYIYVRREIYTKCSDKALRKRRSFGDMRKLFRCSAWIMLLLLVASLAAYIALVLIFPDKLYYIIPALVAFVIPLIWEVSCEKIYNTDARNKEIDEINDNYTEYIRNIKSVLTSCGIDSRQKLDALKSECKARLDAQAKPYKAVSSTVYSMLIGVPLGAIVSSIISQSTGNTAVTQIVGLIMLGLIIIGICNVFKAYSYYSSGRFKDQYLLDVLNELDYSDFQSQLRQ